MGGRGSFTWRPEAVQERASFPSNGSFWLDNDAFWYVLNGTLNVIVENQEFTLSFGDMLWVASGVPVGQFSYGSGSPQLFETGSDWRPHFQESLPSFGQHKGFGCVACPNVTRFRFYKFLPENWMEDPFIHGGECTSKPCGKVMIFPASQDGDSSALLGDPEVGIGKWEPMQYVPGHSHACSAIYMPISGKLCSIENAKGTQLDICTVPGEARWVRPGYRYIKEYSDPGATFFALNHGCGGNFDDIPLDVPYTAYMDRFHVTYIPSPMKKLRG